MNAHAIRTALVGIFAPRRDVGRLSSMKPIAALFAILVLAGCAGAERPNHYAAEGQVFETVQNCNNYDCATEAEELQAGQYKVWARERMNQHDQAADYARLKAAEITLKSGNSHFSELSDVVILHPGYLEVVLTIATAAEAGAGGEWQSAQETYDRLAPLYLENP